MTEWVEQWICIKFCIKLEHSSTETLWMIHKAFRGNATAMDNWWLAASSQQCTHSCITSPAELYGETSNHPGDSAPLQPRFGTLGLLYFPKSKITFQREEISDHQRDSGKYDGAADGNSNKGFCSVFFFLISKFLCLIFFFLLLLLLTLFLEKKYYKYNVIQPCLKWKVNIRS